MTPTIRTTATSTEAFTRSHGYDDNGRPSRTVHPSGLSVSYEYNARGYLSNLKRGSAALVTYAGMDAWGNTTRETYGNGVTTARTFDAATGRATGIDTAQGTAAFLDGSRTAGRTLNYGYDALGNLTSKTSDAAGDADAAPKARDEFRYGPAGERYHRRIAWEETLADGTSRARTAEVYRVGAYERVVGDAHAGHARVEKTHVGPALEVRTSATSSAPVFEYVHADHLGSAAAVTDASGAELLTLAHDPYGTRRRADWTAQLPAAEVAALAAGQDAGRARSGFTGHEPLDRTGFVHMNGRLYDPRVGRFLSPDPIVSEPWSAQGWNPYSYVGNSPLSRTDPTGYCYVAGPMCQIGQGGGFASGTATLLSRSLSWRVPIVLAVHWGPVSFGIGWGGFLNGGDDGGGLLREFLRRLLPAVRERRIRGAVPGGDVDRADGRAGPGAGCGGRSDGSGADRRYRGRRRRMGVRLPDLGHGRDGDADLRGLPRRELRRRGVRRGPDGLRRREGLQDRRQARQMGTKGGTRARCRQSGGSPSHRTREAGS